ncbi:MAG: shikimate kinase [Acidobacteria bacterium]|nr:shikimate kinase [Acidobacteriota bacterium]
MIVKLRRAPGVYLVGFMGSGKSTVGQLLAEELGWRFVDLDDDIEAREQMPITRIFSERGEPEFRRIEHECLAVRVNEVRDFRPLVLALGGGAFVQEQNRLILEKAGITIWLDCPFDLLERRVAGFEHRPLAKDPAGFRRLYEERRALYALSDYRVPIVGDDAAATVRAIMDLPGVF